MNKEQAIKRAWELEESYNYWFEIFRRSMDQSEKEKAKKNYQTAIEENINLQKEYDLSIPPRHSSRDRAEMRIDKEAGKLALSEMQLKEQRATEEFEKDKKTLEEDITKNLIERKSEYIEEVLNNMLSAGLQTENKTITEKLDSLGFFKPDPKLSIEIRIQLLLPFFVLSFEPFLSGEIFVGDLYKAYGEAVESYRIHRIEKAEELFEDCLKMLGKAAASSVLRAGKSYFEVCADRLKSDWGSAKRAIKNQTELETRQREIKDKVLGLIANNSGILQTGIYQLLDSYKKAEISEVLYFLAREKRISREKEGKTYRLYNILSLSKDK